MAKEDGRKFGNRKYKPLSETNKKLFSRIVKNDPNIDYSNLATYSSQVVTLICEECNDEYDSTVNKANSKNRVTCHKCSMSVGEKYIYEFLESNDIKFIKEYVFDDLLNKEGTHYLRFDFALFKEDKLMGIVEFDGGYHFEECHGNDTDYNLRNYYDITKDNYCVSKNIPLKRVPYTEFNNIEILLCKFLSDIGIDSEKFQIRFNQLINKRKTKLENDIKNYYKKIDKLNNELKILNEY